MYSGHWTFTYSDDGYLTCGNPYTNTNRNDSPYSDAAAHNHANRQAVERTGAREADSNARRRRVRTTDLVFCIPRWTLERADNRKTPNR